MSEAITEIDTSVWYRPEIGPRLKPSSRFVYSTWSQIPDKELISHLHKIVSPKAAFLYLLPDCLFSD